VRQIASEATTVRFRRIEVEGDAVLDARRTAQAVTAYVLSNQCDMKPPGPSHQRWVSANGVPAQPVDATQALNLSAGVSNCKVSRGRSFS
jgi:hypothetical protein